MSAIAQVEPLTTARALRGPFDYRLPQELVGEVGVGSMLVVPFGRRRLLGVVTALSDRSELAEERLLAPLRALDSGPPTLPLDLVALAAWLAEEYCSTLARSLALVLPPAAARRLSGRRRRAVPELPAAPPVGAHGKPVPRLTGEQEQAFKDLRSALDSGVAHTRLLAGVTGSGKTEVYLRVAEHALREGRGVIVLVPEIALTPQILTRFNERLGEAVAVLHSGLTLAQRREQWRRLRAGEARVCVGPRSAVFAPIERLGLIVIDEEHEASYKHEGDPRYDARAVAARRSSDCGAVLLLGSATPRPESVRAARKLELRARVDARPLPQVQVLDMCRQSHALHPLTVQALTDVRAAGAKAIVLLNRRGWSNFLTCRSCGHVWGCPQCDVALVLHRNPANAGARRSGRDHVACHHCGYSRPLPRRCECGSTSLVRHGAGTERLQHELTATLDDGRFPIFRLDADTAQARASEADGIDEGGVAAVLARFQAAPAGVLIGTQMVAKGHDFPDVALGVVLDADATLRFPDFRAEERTFALVTQLAGRVGRGREGRVLVQTIAPQARSIVHAASHDSDGFLAGELERRRALDYPPFASLIRVVCAADTLPSARAAAGELRAQLDASAARVLGPATLFRLRGRERQVLVAKAPNAERAATIAAVGAAVAKLAGERKHAGVSFSVDVDPQ